MSNNFIKYQHVERFGTSEVEGIELGECYIFPKIDGTNSSVWLGNDGQIKAGSRKRQLSLDLNQDNAGFYKWVKTQNNLLDYLEENQTHILYGEWLVPHSLKTYRETAWRNFYVFDVVDSDEPGKHIPYDIYAPTLKKFDIDYIPPLIIINNPTYDQLVDLLDKNTFLIQDGKGSGEGIVIKNYNYFNKYGRQTWAKIVTSEFKDKHAKTMGATNVNGKKLIEEEIAKKYVTTALCEKVKAKIELDNNGFSSKQIPRLLNTIYYDIIKEESWNFIKEYKNPTINYKTLQYFIFTQVKECMKSLF
jgi:hypothetical protein